MRCCNTAWRSSAATGGSEDLRVLFTAFETLSLCGGDYKIEIGHAQFFDALIDTLELSADEKKAVKAYLAAKNSSMMPFGVSAGQSRALDIARRLPRLCGGAEVLEESRRLAGGSGRAAEIVDYVESVYNAFIESGYADRIIIDMGIVQRIEYYTGLVFKGYIGGIGAPVLSGGRYDQLYSGFGRERTACGFALDVSDVAASRAVSRKEPAEPPLDFSAAAPASRRPRRFWRREGGACDPHCTDKGAHRKKRARDSQGLRLRRRRAGGEGAQAHLPHRQSGNRAGQGRGRHHLYRPRRLRRRFVGSDTINEHGGNFYEMLDLGFGVCRFALAGLRGQDFYSGYQHKVVATKYPVVARKYFSEKGVDCEIVRIDGSVELAPLLGAGGRHRSTSSRRARPCARTVWEVYEDILPVSARCIVNAVSIKLKNAEIGEFLRRVEEAKA